jgi:hypothetical protein
MLSRKTLRAGLAAGLLLLAPALAHRASAQAPRREPTPNENLKSVEVLVRLLPRMGSGPLQPIA